MVQSRPTGGRERKWIAGGSLILLSLLVVGWSDSWQAIESELKNVTSIQAEFVQEKHLKILVKPLISRGKFIFKVPGSLRWEYQSPIENILIMHQGQVQRWVKKGSKLAADTGTPIEIMDIVMEEIAQWLQGRFLDNPNFSASRIESNQIQLTPVNAAMAPIIQGIVIQLSAVPGAIDSVTIFESPDNFTRIMFKRVRLNQPIDEGIFTLTGP
jgi:outer membrane lipoprotein-sorting protein